MKKSYLFIVTVIMSLFALNVYADGHVATVTTFDITAAELPEGVTVDSNGNVYMSLSPLGQILKIAVETDSPELFGQVPGLQEGDIGLLGIAANSDGDIYGAVVSTNPEANGIWRFDADTGAADKLAGTESIMFPNAVAFGDNGDVYATDSIMGAVWVIRDGESAEVWLNDDLITGNNSLGFGVPLGANGIDVQDRTVYVGVLELASIMAIPIMEDGSAGEASVWAQLPAGNHVDGIILDNNGNVIVAAPTSNLVLQVSPDGSVEALATVSDSLDAPASVAYYLDANGNASVYVTNFSVAVNPAGGAGPSIMQISLNNN